jgi:hypothetical protein
VAPENAIGVHSVAVWVRAVATSADGDQLASAPIVAALVRYGPPYPQARAPSVNDGIVFSGSKPIHVTWSVANSWYRLPDGRIVAVPLAGYAVDVVDQHDQDAREPQPPAKIVTTPDSRSYEVTVPPLSEHPHVVVIRAIDVVGNVGDWAVGVQFWTESLVLDSPRAYAAFRGSAPVPLRVFNASSRPVCVEYRAADHVGSGPPYLPLPPGELTDASGRPIGAQPVKIARAGTLFHWHGLRHASKAHGEVQIRVVRTTGTRGCGGVAAVSRPVTITWAP